eukprot:857713-Karenia_brevis.AAC.1
MRLVMIESLDMVVASCPLVQLTCYVDDVSIECPATEKIIEMHLVEAVEIFTSNLQEAQLEFSDKKNVLAASSAGLAKKLLPRFAKLSVRNSPR